MSLGGVRDEAEIRGHRRTYIGALPGRLVRALRDAGTMNPVILLDEVDKVGADWRGDPSAALLEVLDPAQNDSFRDHYLDVEVDLSQVVFIATANVAETIPGPLLDRMEVIRFDGYTTDEKAAIARGYLWPRQRERAGLHEEEVSIADDALEAVVSEYTREAGVRQLERELGTILRKTATRIASNAVEPPVTIDLPAVRDALGRQKFYREAAERTAVPGVASGLAVNATGGDVLFVEATALKGGDRLLPDRNARRRDAGVRADRALCRAVARRGARHRPRVVRGPLVPRPRAGRRDPEGRAERRHHHGNGAGVAAHPAAGQAHGRHDRRADAAGPRPADRRAQAEGARRARSRADRRCPARAEPADIDDVPAHVREEMTFHPVMSLAEVLDLALEPSRPPTMSRCRTCAPVPEEVRRAASLLEGRWTVSILYASYEGASRFNEFRQAVGTIPPRTSPSACSTSSRPACWSGSSSTRDRLGSSTA